MASLFRRWQTVRPALLGLALASSACRSGGDDDGAPSTSTDTPTTDSGVPTSPTGETARGPTADTASGARYVQVAVDEGPRVTCEDPAAREAQRYEVLFSQAEDDKPHWFWGGGTIMGDLDGDQRLDVLLPGLYETFYYRGSSPDPFDDASASLDGLALRGASGGSVADYDGDGDLDVLVTRFLAPDVLLRNDSGQLVDVSVEAGLQREGLRSMANSWGDIDGDGDLDLFVGGYGVIDQSQTDPDHANFDPGDPAVLYLNDGDGTFTDVSDRLPQEAHDGLTFSGGFLDADLDGDLDLYIVNDFGNSFPNVLLRNTGDGTFERWPEAGLDVPMTGMGLAVGDINGDRLPDFAMGAWNGNHLFKSTEVGWVDFTATTNFVNDLDRTQKVAWATEFHDMDNDGDLDAPMVYGHLDAVYPSSELQPDAMYLQLDDGSFEDVGQQWGMNHPTVGRGFVVADLDDNGFLDMVKRDLEGPSLTYLARCGPEHWLRVRLHQPGMNRFAVGARVELRSTAGSHDVLTRSVFAGTIGHASGGPPEVHFGLGATEVVDRLVVVWPDGARSLVENQGVDRVIDIRR